MLCNQYKPCCAASLEIRDWSLVTGSLLDVCVCVGGGGSMALAGVAPLMRGIKIW